MALIIHSTTNNQIRSQGTAINLTSVYNRLEFSCYANGVTIEIKFHTYADHDAFIAGEELSTDLPLTPIIGDIDLTTQTQDLAAAHLIAKSYFESLGYIVSIDLV